MRALTAPRQLLVVVYVTMLGAWELHQAHPGSRLSSRCPRLWGQVQGPVCPPGLTTTCCVFTEQREVAPANRASGHPSSLSCPSQLGDPWGTRALDWQVLAMALPLHTVLCSPGVPLASLGTADSDCRGGGRTGLLSGQAPGACLASVVSPALTPWL